MNRHALACAVAVASATVCDPAAAWGPVGHRVIGRAAQPLLCSDARAAVPELAAGESLEQIGLWADQIRGRSEWSHTAPWHYVNVPDDGNPRQPPATDGGNVIVAIERFAEVLADAAADSAQRANALRFVVHFVADVHQPLHVGRADDRGGNEIDVSFEAERRNLHYFWDTAVIRLSGLSIDDYAAKIAPEVAAIAQRDRGQGVRDWAEQVFALRTQVYAFDAESGALSDEYLDIAMDIAEQQLASAAAHLANALNEALCP